MSNPRRSEIRLIEQFVAWPRGIGYVLDFSDRTFQEYFEDEFRVDIYDPAYQDRGSSKRHHLIAFCLKESPTFVARVLRALADKRRELATTSSMPPDDGLEDRFDALVTAIETRGDQPSTDALYRYEQDRTLDELVADLQRTLDSNKPEAALDHLHTYCMKKLAYLLSLREVACAHNEPLHARFGKYRRCLLKETDLHESLDLAMKAAISVLQKFNDVRNHRSLAHDSVILGHHEARYIFDVVTALPPFHTLPRGWQVRSRNPHVPAIRLIASHARP